MRFREEDRGFETPCWVWVGAFDRDGYGMLRFGGKQWRVHRLLYVILVAALRPSVDLHHRCEVKACVRPTHLEALSKAAHGARHTFGKKGMRGRFGNRAAA